MGLDRDAADQWRDIIKHQITTVAMVDMDRKSNIVKERLLRNIRSSGTLKAIWVGLI